MTSYIIDDFNFYNLPSNFPGIANSGKYKFANYSHNNVNYHMSRGKSASDTNGPADCTYDREFGSEILKMYLLGWRDRNGRRLTKENFEALSLTYGTTVERNTRPPGANTVFNCSIGETVTASRGAGNPLNTYLAGGTKIQTKMGGVRLDVTKSAGGFVSDGTTGGVYHWADPTPELYNS